MHCHLRRPPVVLGLITRSAARTHQALLYPISVQSDNLAAAILLFNNYANLGAIRLPFFIWSKVSRPSWTYSAPWYQISADRSLWGCILDNSTSFSVPFGRQWTCSEISAPNYTKCVQHRSNTGVLLIIEFLLIDFRCVAQFWNEGHFKATSVKNWG